MSLETYQQRRDFRRTPEPRGKVSKVNRHRFVVQEHHAKKLHFDFRLEMGGVLKSWSVPRGPSLDPQAKRLAVPTEDHPVEYLKFEGHIPEGNYGAGEHMIWDAGTYELTEGTDALRQYEDGRLRFRLRGDKLRGEFNLVRMSGRENQWLLIKSRDEDAKTSWSLKLRAGTAEEQESLNRKPAPRSAGRTTERRYSAQKKDDGKAIAASAAFKAKKLSGDVDLKVGRDVIALRHLDKIYWPDAGYTKGDLVKYYYEVSKLILPYLKDRPLIMKRYPEGIKGLSFHQHDVDRAPDYVRTAAIEVEEGHTVNYIVGDNLQTLLYMANLGAIERHAWHSRVSNLDQPDWFVFDLDPGEGVQYGTICDVALSVREVLERVGLECFPKTSGSRGLHIYVPIKAIYSYELVADFAEKIATLVASENAQVATVERALKKRRRGQIYLDHMQNARGKSVVAPYSVRPREGATVSAPLDWREVERKKITPQDFHIKNTMQRLERKGELFKPVLSRKQSLGRAVKELEKLLERPRAKGAQA